MKRLIVGDQATVARPAKHLKRAGPGFEYRRFHCAMIRATLGASAEPIAELPGWSTATVHVLQPRWAKAGDADCDARYRGGRRNPHRGGEQERVQAAFKNAALRGVPRGRRLLATRWPRYRHTRREPP
jgi:hypothetical protein